MMRRTLIVANKSWEVDPLMAVLKSKPGRPSTFPDEAAVPVANIKANGGTDRGVKARAAFKYGGGIVEIWCVEDLMDPSANKSSSEEKALTLPAIAGCGPTPDLVIAFGTANSPDQNSFNGCVAVGSKFFIHNSKSSAPNPKSNWVDPAFEGILSNGESDTTADLIKILDGRLRSEIEMRFISPPLNPARSQTILASAASVAVSNVNITDYDEYVWADREAICQFEGNNPRSFCASVETTHGVIRLKVPGRQFMYVSGIANRLGYYNSEVSPRLYAQNFVASHNAAIAVAWLIPYII